MTGAAPTTCRAPLDRAGAFRLTPPMTAIGCATASPQSAPLPSSGQFRAVCRPPEPDREAYRRRDCIERFFSKLKQYRAIAARYEKRDANFLAIIKLPATRIRSRVYEPVA